MSSNLFSPLFWFTINATCCTLLKQYCDRVLQTFLWHERVLKLRMNEDSNNFSHLKGSVQPWLPFITLWPSRITEKLLCACRWGMERQCSLAQFFERKGACESHFWFYHLPKLDCILWLTASMQLQLFKHVFTEELEHRFQLFYRKGPGSPRSSAFQRAAVYKASKYCPCSSLEIFKHLSSHSFMSSMGPRETKHSMRYT